MFRFDNSYARLPGRFFVELDPMPVEDPAVVAFNTSLADEIGVSGVSYEAGELAAIFSGNVVPQGAKPLAMAYAGHQFGSFVPQLGDGRAHLLGEVIDRCGERRDIQLKGSGQTPFSRNGDGRAALGPVLREYLVSEAMHALGIPTTRALAAVTTGQEVYRDEPLPGAVLTRVAASHLRVGTFEYFAARNDLEALRALANHAIERHDPAASEADEPYLALLQTVVNRQASLVARWLHVGFIHGVMNTDNTAISGETIDFGPCAFMDAYDPATVFSSIDRYGRYAYANQPRIAQWNLARFAETLLPLIDADAPRAVERVTLVVQGFASEFERQWVYGMRRKLGLAGEEEGDPALAAALLDLMQAAKADYTLTFRRLCDFAEGLDPAARAGAQELFGDQSGPFLGWATRWLQRASRDTQAPAERAAAMRAVNPAVIPRNHRVEEALQAAVRDADYEPFERLGDMLARPFDDNPSAARFLAPPLGGRAPYRTFCGT